MSAPRQIPDSECVQSKCACTTTGCWGECNMKRFPVLYGAPLPAAPVAPEVSDDEWSVMAHGPKSIIKREDWDAATRRPKVATPLPAAPAPTRATPEQEAEINAAVKAGRITFEPGWNDPRAAELPPPPEGDEAGMFSGGAIVYTEDQMEDYARAAYAIGLGAAVRDYISLNDAALATRQAPTEEAEEDRALFLSAAAYTLPEYQSVDGYKTDFNKGFSEGWNACRDKIVEINLATPATEQAPTKDSGEGAGS